jgi:hypothetical protein
MQKLHEITNSQKPGHLYKFKKHTQMEIFGSKKTYMGGKEDMWYPYFISLFHQLLHLQWHFSVILIFRLFQCIYQVLGLGHTQE